jgi:hypothetical protein
VLAAGGRVVGVIPRMLIERECAHPNLTTQHVVTTMHERKTLMADMSDAFVGLPAAWERSTSWSRSSPGRSSACTPNP